MTSTQEAVSMDFQPRRCGQFSRLVITFMVATLGLLVLIDSAAHAGETLTGVKTRGTVRCGVSNDSPGMAFRSPAGVWSGMDVDFCRAVAAATLGDPEKVSFIPLAPLARFSSLMAKEIDVLSRNTTWTLGREATFKAAFVGPWVFTEQGILTKAADAKGGVAGLNNATICVVKGTTHAANLAEIAQRYGVVLKPVVFDDSSAATEAFLADQCRGLTEDATVLEVIRKARKDNPPPLALLSDRFSKEPISPAARLDDPLWLLVLRSVHAALITAEETGLRRADLDARGKITAERPELLSARHFLLRADELAKPLELAPGWAGRAVAAVGNYGEIFDRNLGAASPIGLERGLNRLWNQGGLLYAPPF